MTRFDLKPGDRFQIDDARFVARGTIETEPDKLAVGLSFGPRVLVSIEALRATGLLQPGSIVHWLYRVRLPAGATPEQVDATADAARTAFRKPAGRSARATKRLRKSSATSTASRSF